jgi:hypothetical protein
MFSSPQGIIVTLLLILLLFFFSVWGGLRMTIKCNGLKTDLLIRSAIQLVGKLIDGLNLQYTIYFFWGGIFAGVNLHYYGKYNNWCGHRGEPLAQIFLI